MGQVMRDCIVGLSWDFATVWDLQRSPGPVVHRPPDLELVGACDGTVTAAMETTLTRLRTVRHGSLERSPANPG